MRHRSLHRCCGCVLAALLLSLTHGARAEAAERPAATAPSPAAMAEYRRKLEEYTLARGKYEAEADAYWSSIADKRKLRRVKRRNNQDIALGDYVLTSRRSIRARQNGSIRRRRPRRRHQESTCRSWPTFCGQRRRNSILFRSSLGARWSTNAPTPRPLPPRG